MLRPYLHFLYVYNIFCICTSLFRLTEAFVLSAHFLSNILRLTGHLHRLLLTLVS